MPTPRGLPQRPRRTQRKKPGMPSTEPIARRLEPGDLETLDVMGATIQFLTQADGDGACLMRGTIPPGGCVPMHSHPDFETFVQLSGELEGLSDAGDGWRWLRLRPGDVFHVPAGARHAFRNPASSPAIGIVASTPRMARFFREIGVGVIPGQVPGPPSAERIRHFLDTAAAYGHWNASPEENARVGLSLPGA